MPTSTKGSRVGLAHPDVVDLVTHDHDKENWKLIVVETEAWDGSVDRLLQLQGKLNNYLAFALDGQMHRLYPESIEKHVAIQLDCYEEPDQRTVEFLETAKQRVAEEGIGLYVNVVPKTTGHG